MRIACGRCVFSGQWSTVGSARYTEAIERLGIHLLTTRIAYRSKFNKELLADGAGIGRSTLLAAERSFARDAGIEALAQEIRTLVIPE